MINAATRCGRVCLQVSEPGAPDVLLIRPGQDVPIFICRSLEQFMDVVELDLPLALVEIKSGRHRLNARQKAWHQMVTGAVNHD